MKNKRIIIVGSGASIRNHLWETPIEDLPLWDKLKDEFTITLNWSYKWLWPTILLYHDSRFYCTEQKRLDSHPFLLGLHSDFYVNKLNYQKHIDKVGDNLHLLKSKTTNLSGNFALDIATRLEAEEIYLLGYDLNSTDGRTHFYEGDADNTGVIDWKNQLTTGIGQNKDGVYKTSFYNLRDVNTPFEVFKNAKSKIYNVSPDSRLEVFEKISYELFYEKLTQEKEKLDQDLLREEAKKILLHEKG